MVISVLGVLESTTVVYADDPEIYMNGISSFCIVVSSNLIEFLVSTVRLAK